MTTRVTRRRGNQGYLQGTALVLSALLVVGVFATGTMHASADNFTDIFYTNSFRGAFQWFKYLDWVGMLVQIVISAFSLFGVALMTIRIMTSLLFLSAKGMWEEVHDLKSQGGSEEKDLFGMLGMAKSWVQGKAGTGLDAIIGAVLLLLPDVKKYSDFGEKAGGDFSEDMTVTQYILKIAVPTVMTVFFFAMGFNGTLFHALAVTVDFLGDIADRAISVNYTGMVEDLVNKNVGYKFIYDLDGSEEGKFKQALAKDIYGRVVAKVRGADAVTLEYIGNQVQGLVDALAPSISSEGTSGSAGSFGDVTVEPIWSAPTLTEKVKNGLNDPGQRDAFMQYISVSPEIARSGSASGAFTSIPLSSLLPADSVAVAGAAEGETESGLALYIFVKCSSDYNGTFVQVQ